MNKELKEAIQVVKDGGVVLYLSDTIWGIGCDPRNEKAVEKVQKIKRRPSNKSFIVLISQVEQLNDHLKKVPELAWDLVEFAEDPLTVIYPDSKFLPHNVIAEDGSVGIRLVKGGECLDFVKGLRYGLLSTSANLSGEPSPKSFSEISQEVLNEVDYILSSDAKADNKPSKIVKLGVNGEFKIIRE